MEHNVRHINNQAQAAFRGDMRTTNLTKYGICLDKSFSGIQSPSIIIYRINI